MAGALMSGQGNEYGKLAEKYGNFYVPALSIEVGGTSLSTIGLFTEGVEVALTLDGPSTATFSLINVYDPVKGAFISEATSKVKLGARVEVKLGYGSSLHTVFVGFVAQLDASFAEGSQPVINVSCTDVRRLMMEANEQKQFPDCKSYSQAVEKLLGESQYSGFLEGTEIESTPARPKNDIGQANETDYDFVERLASESDYEFFIMEGVAYFQKRHKNKSSSVTFEWGTGLLSFSRDLSLRTFVTKVVVVGRKINSTETIEGVAERATPPGSLKSVTQRIIDSTIYEKEACEARARTELAKIAETAFSGSASCIGLPEVIPGRCVTFKRLSPEVDGTYYVTSASHSLGSGGFTTNFSIGVKP